MEYGVGTSYGVRVTGYELRGTGYELRGTGYELRGTGYGGLRVWSSGKTEEVIRYNNKE
jgi:hypothetical protein